MPPRKMRGRPREDASRRGPHRSRTARKAMGRRNLRRSSTGGMANIRHMVVVMLENRSFDNMVGWLYWSEQNRPPINLPRNHEPTYDGLTPEKSNPGTSGQTVTVRHGTAGHNPWLVPTPDPQELFDHMKVQMFQRADPLPGQAPTMLGFVQDYATVVGNASPDSIMECFTPAQVPVISALARNYAICDRWFASVPCQTWPNRAFVHAGTSCGRVNNCNDDEDDCVPDPLYYDTRTIFNFLEDIGVSWKVYNDSVLMSLTRAQFITHLGDPLLEGHFHSFGQFRKDALAGRLPAYAFVEPSFVVQPSDEHPPHDVRVGEKFLHDVWTAVSGGKHWRNTLLVITYDEHGGCFDHVPPPETAVKPDEIAPQAPFDFHRYGVRVPTVVVSPYIEPGTVFRSASPGVEYDHSAILATLRDWVDPTGKHKKKMLASKRIKAAPKLDMVLTRATPRTDLPLISPPPAEFARAEFAAVPPDTPLNSIQKAVIAASMIHHRGAVPGDPFILQEVGDRVKTHADAIHVFQELL
jgi:phospholipase C